MKLINKLFLGTWILRSTNDNLLSDGISYIIIKNDDTIKFRTLNQEGIFGTKKSITAQIINITYYNDFQCSTDIRYLYSNKYSFSLAAIEFPEYISNKKEYMINKNLNITLFEKTLLVQDTKLPLYYLFDLHIGKIKNPFIETTFPEGSFI